MREKFKLITDSSLWSDLRWTSRSFSVLLFILSLKVRTLWPTNYNVSYMISRIKDIMITVIGGYNWGHEYFYSDFSFPLISLGEALSCYTYTYDWEMEPIQPRWGRPHLNVTGPEQGVRECVNPEINVCMTSHLRDGEKGDIVSG